MREIASSALHGTTSSLQVDPEEVSEERLLEVAVDVRVVNDPQQLVHGNYRLTHRFDESILSLHINKLVSKSEDTCDGNCWAT